MSDESTYLALASLYMAALMALVIGLAYLFT